MVCAAVLYARVNQRAMIRRAEKAGADPKLLWQDVWKWMAGPEWAFAAAGIIIALSFIGAPLMQTSLQGVSSQVNIQVQSQVQNIANRPTNRINSETSIGNGPVILSNTEVFKVKTSEPNYLRGKTYTRYTGKGWNSSRTDARGSDSPFLTIGDTQVLADRERERLLPYPYQEVNVFINPTLPLSPTLISPGPILTIQDTNTYKIDSEGTTVATTTSRLTQNLEYTAAVSTGSPIRARAIDIQLPFSDGIDYQTTEQVPRSVRDLAESAISGAGTDFEKAMAIKQFIERTVKYNTKAPATPGTADPVEYCLITSKQGYCDVFASSMILMARSVGMSARYATGYLMSNAKPESDGSYSIKESDSHAWAEIYFEDVGWVIFDATEGAEYVDGGEVGSTTSRFQQWLATVPLGPILAIVGFGSAIAIIIAWALYFRKSPDFVVEKSTRKYVARSMFQYQRSVEKAVKAPKRFSATIREYTNQHAAELGSLAPEATALVTRFESGLYAKSEPSDQEIKSLQDDVKEFVRKVKALKKSWA
ncbi:MAG: transglutaminaseTgpA domain-containing protein [Fimbriimonadaceae bacterium]